LGQGQLMLCFQLIGFWFHGSTSVSPWDQ
jgi:hypothetical protein